MKKLLIPIALALTPALYAGGNTTPVTEIAAVSDSSSWYLGVGASMMNLSADLTDESLETMGATLQAGYAYNEYIAVELRYTANITAMKYDKGTTVNLNNDDYPSDMSNIGIYLKPIYPIGDFSVYALLGYGAITITDLPTGTTDRTEKSFQWGIGASYQVTDSISVFTDYTNFYDDVGLDGHFATSNIKVDSITFGMSYKF